MNKKLIKKLVPNLSKNNLKKLVRKELEQIHARAKDTETVQYIDPHNINSYTNVKYDSVGNPYIVLKI